MKDRRSRRSPPAFGAEAAFRLLVAVAVFSAVAGWLAVSAWAAENEASPSPPHMVMRPANVGDTTPEVNLILKGLVCRCGCNLTVAACEGTMTCDVAKKMRADVEKDVAAGMTRQEVFDSFASDYGEQVLAAPTKKGFNLTAWLMPFVALALGGALVGLALRSWRPARAASREEIPEADPKYVEAVEEELKREA